MSSKLTAGFQAYGADLMDVEAYVKALELDGVNECVAVANHASLRITSNLSYNVWIKCGSQGTSDMIAIMWDGGTNQRSWFLRTSTAGGQERRLQVALSTDGINIGKVWVTTNDVLPVSGWAMVTMTFDAAGSLEVYVSAAKVAAWTKTIDLPIVTLHPATCPFYLSALTGGWTGQLCNASIWDTGVLSQADIAALFNSGDSMDPDDLVPTGGAVLVSSWLWNLELPLVPGANDIPDNAGGNAGSTQNVEALDVVDSPFVIPVAVSIADGFYADDAATATALEAAIQAVPGYSGANVFPPSAGTPKWEIDGAGPVMGIAWTSLDLRAYMGFADDLSGATSYLSRSAVGSTWFPDAFAEPIFRRVLGRLPVSDHTGYAAGALLGYHFEIDGTVWIDQDDQAIALAVLRRFWAGARGKLRLCANNANPFAWTAIGWDGEHSVALAKPDAGGDLGQWLSAPYTGLRSLRLAFTRWT